MTGPARLRVQVLQGDLVVHEFSRSTAQPSARGITAMTGSALAWLQCWSGQLSDAQWAADVRRALAAQRLAEQQDDGIPVVPASTRTRD